MRGQKDICCELLGYRLFCVYAGWVGPTWMQAEEGEER